MFAAFKYVVCIIFVVQFGVCEAQESINLLADTEDDKFKVGQRWKYKTRKHEKESTLLILKIEESLNETIIHVAIKGLNIKNPRAFNGISQNIRHLPFSKKALAQSVTKLKSKKNPIPEYESGYKEWKDAYLAGEGGILSIPVQEAVVLVEEANNQ